MFYEQYERQEPLFKSHEESALFIISSNTKITTQQFNKFNKNPNKIESQGKQNHNFLNTCQTIHDDNI